ncbi:hypothetical protein D3C72_2564940 [compost metagenome]
MQSQTMPRSLFSQVRDVQFDAQLARAQMEPLASAISEGGCAVELQDHFIRG